MSCENCIFYKEPTYKEWLKEVLGKCSHKNSSVYRDGYCAKYQTISIKTGLSGK